MSDDFEAEVRQAAEAEGVTEENISDTGVVTPSGQAEPQKEDVVKNYQAAFQEEREKRKKERERADKLEETFRKFVEHNTQAKPEPAAQEEEFPDPESDLGGFLYKKQGSLEKQLKEFKERAAKEEEQRLQYIQQNQLLNNYRSQAAQYSQSNPEFAPAYQALMQDRSRELELMGFSPEQIPEILVQDEMMIVNQSLAAGQNPAERIFNIAKHRNLVKPAQQQPQKNVEMMFDAADKASRMADVSGATSKAQISLEQLASINDEAEFNKAWNKLMRNN